MAEKNLTSDERLIRIETIVERIDASLGGLPDAVTRLQEFRSSVTHQIWDEEGSRIERALRTAESTAKAQSTTAARLWTAVISLLTMFAGVCISAYMALEKMEVTHVLKR